jgi:hypothetical protein
MTDIREKIKQEVQALTEQANATQEARAQRRATVKSVQRSARMEGQPVSAQTAALLDGYAEGQLSSDDVLKALDQRYKR